MTGYYDRDVQKHLRMRKAKEDLKKRKREAADRGWLVYKTRKLLGL